MKYIIPKYLHGLYCEAGDRADIYIYISGSPIIKSFFGDLEIIELTKTDNDIGATLKSAKNGISSIVWKQHDIAKAKSKTGPPLPEIMLYMDEGKDDEDVCEYEFWRPSKLAEYGMADGDPANAADFSNRLDEFGLKEQIEPNEYRRLMAGERYDAAMGNGWV